MNQNKNIKEVYIEKNRKKKLDQEFAHFLGMWRFIWFNMLPKEEILYLRKKCHFSELMLFCFLLFYAFKWVQKWTTLLKDYMVNTLKKKKPMSMKEKAKETKLLKKTTISDVSSNVIKAKKRKGKKKRAKKLLKHLETILVAKKTQVARLNVNTFSYAKTKEEIASIKKQIVNQKEKVKKICKNNTQRPKGMRPSVLRRIEKRICSKEKGFRFILADLVKSPFITAEAVESPSAFAKKHQLGNTYQKAIQYLNQLNKKSPDYYRSIVENLGFQAVYLYLAKKQGDPTRGRQNCIVFVP